MPADANAARRRRRIAEAVHGKVATAFRARPKIPPKRGSASPSPGPPQSRFVPRPDKPSPQSQSFPEVTDPICRLPLPTLFYRLEAVHLGDLLRIWVRPGTKFTLSPWDFQGPTRTHRTPQEPRCFTEPRSLSPGKPIPGMGLLTKKRKLFPGLPPTSPTSFALPHIVPEDKSPCPGSGILTRFPFDS